MPLTLGLTGMDAATEIAIKAAFADANTRLGKQWSLVPDSQAEYVIVDMDSMYGPMSWLRLHAAGKTVIGLTSAPRTQADFLLPQPVDSEGVAALLQELAAATGESLDLVAVDIPMSTRADTPSPAGMTPAPVPQDPLPGEVVDQDEEASDPDQPAVPAPSAVAPPVNVAPPEPVPLVDEGPDSLLGWLTSPRLKGRVRLAHGDVPLLIDADARTYHGPALLKPLADHFQRKVEDADLETIDAAAWAAASAAAGDAQPLNRLVWFGALVSGGGKLAGGFPPDTRFQMLKWPQTEREYPKHFRIATVMMKGPATVVDIAQASGVPEPDVTDFVNANLATGFADIERPPEPEPDATRSSGLFGRLRGR
ncbi:hypothetical protein [Lysobacter sp. A3-1-A15]|uniref:hypothetical protein n=1 Tax=Novilysobacter viscosus TaxID=3098602 RepID=UPI002ED9067D